MPFSAYRSCQGDLPLLDRSDHQVAAGGRGSGVQAIGPGVLPHGLGKIAALLKGASGRKMGQGLDALDLGLVAGLAGYEGSGQVVELGSRGGRKQRARGQGEYCRGQYGQQQTTANVR